MINVNDIKNGMTIMIEGQIYQVVEFLHVKPGKGSAFMKTKLSADQIGDSKNYLIENMNVYVILYEGELLGIDLPDKVEFTVVETEPAVRGNTTNNALKDATVETGLVVKVPLFIEQGEKILVTTADGKYSSRA